VPLFAMLWGDLFLHEHPTLQMLAGGAIVLLGVALSTGWIRPPRPSA
jgi:drug/metabolite transporter (DMT)-like permease